LTKENEKKSENEAQRLPLTLSDLIASEAKWLHGPETIARYEKLGTEEKHLEKLLAETSDTTQSNIVKLFYKFALLERSRYVKEEMDLRTLEVIAREIEQLKRKSKRRAVRPVTYEEMQGLIRKAVAKEIATYTSDKGHEAMYGHGVSEEKSEH
jgi:hypothetical protein